LFLSLVGFLGILYGRASGTEPENEPTPMAFSESPWPCRLVAPVESTNCIPLVRTVVVVPAGVQWFAAVTGPFPQLFEENV
jgi:hypothetical protein